jgi:hypothetical protein
MPSVNSIGSENYYDFSGSEFAGILAGLINAPSSSSTTATTLSQSGNSAGTLWDNFDLETLYMLFPDLEVYPEGYSARPTGSMVITGAAVVLPFEIAAFDRSAEKAAGMSWVDYSSLISRIRQLEQFSFPVEYDNSMGSYGGGFGGDDDMGHISDNRGYFSQLDASNLYNGTTTNNGQNGYWRTVGGGSVTYGDGSTSYQPPSTVWVPLGAAAQAGGYYPTGGAQGGYYPVGTFSDGANYLFSATGPDGVRLVDEAAEIYANSSRNFILGIAGQNLAEEKLIASGWQIDGRQVRVVVPMPDGSRAVRIYDFVATSPQGQRQYIEVKVNSSERTPRQVLVDVQFSLTGGIMGTSTNAPFSFKGEPIPPSPVTDVHVEIDIHLNI